MIFRPFYRLDITGTESILSEKSRQGEHLTAFYPLPGIFIFDKGQPAEKSYIIRTGKKDISKKLRSEGWQTVSGSSFGYAAVFDGKYDGTPPSLGNVKRHISVLRLICAFILMYLGGTVIGLFTALNERMSLPPDSEKYIPSVSYFFNTAAGEHSIKYLSVIIVLSAAAVLFLIYLHKCSQKYKSLNSDAVEMDFTVPKENFIFSKQEERKMLRSGEMVRKFKLGWYFSPDISGKYVEDMARRGFIFYRFDKMGYNMYFIKGEPKNISFVTDFQHEITEEYIALNIDDGWKLQFRTATRLAGYAVWTKEYPDDEEKPLFYSDMQSQLECAEKIAAIYTFLFLAITVTYVGLSIMLYNTGMSKVSPDLFYECILLFLAVEIEYFVFAFKSVGYYLRIRKSAKSE